MARPTDPSGPPAVAATAAASLPDLSCRIRREVWNRLLQNSRALRCPPEVYLELLVEKAAAAGVVTEHDVLLHLSDRQMARSMLDGGGEQQKWRSWLESLSAGEREAMAQSLQAMVRGAEDSGVIEVWAPAP